MTSSLGMVFPVTVRTPDAIWVNGNPVGTVTYLVADQTITSTHPVPLETMRDLLRIVERRISEGWAALDGE